MPMHDWTRVEPTIYHHFHQKWVAELAAALNPVLPSGLSALLERPTHPGAVERRPRPAGGGTATAPQTRWTVPAATDPFVRRANRVAIRHRMGEVVCVIEIVSPGNKATRAAVREFVAKTTEFLRGGVNVLLVDPFPPTPRDPHSLHPLVWAAVSDDPFELPPDEPLLLAAYRVGGDLTGTPPTAYLEAARVGGALPDMPAWIDTDFHVPVPLDRSYQTAWDTCPADYRFLVEHGRLPDE